MWASMIVSLPLLASTTSASYLGLLARANKLCPAIVDTIAVTSTLSITVPGVTVTVTPSLPLATASTAGACLSDAQATSIVKAWKAILTSSDRTAAKSTAQALIANEYLETSDSINSLAGNSLGNATFSGKEAFITAILKSPPISLLTTLDIFHDCSRIAFYWAANGVGSDTQEIRGVDLLYLTEDKSQINMAMVEFNSVAWAKDVGWKIQRPGGTEY